MQQIKDAVAKDNPPPLLPDCGKVGGGGFKRDYFWGGHFWFSITVADGQQPHGHDCHCGKFCGPDKHFVHMVKEPTLFGGACLSSFVIDITFVAAITRGRPPPGHRPH
jgi:hypothetical protein